MEGESIPSSYEAHPPAWALSSHPRTQKDPCKDVGGGGTTPSQMKLFLQELSAISETLELMRKQFADGLDRLVVALSSVN